MSLESLSAAFREAAASRRAKLDALDPAHLMLVARAGLLKYGGNENSSVRHIVAVLRSAASRGHQEAAWLLAVLSRHAPIPMEDRWGSTAVAESWLVRIMSLETLPCARFYHGRAAGWEGDVRLQQMRCASESGYAPAMTVLGKMLGDAQEGADWLRKAASLKDPEGLYFQALQSEGDAKFELYRTAAQLGQVESMLCLTEEFRDRCSALELAQLEGRFILLVGWPRESACVSAALAKPRMSDADVELVYTVGKEVEGFEQFWDPDRSPHPEVLKSVEVFLLVSHRARRAALQTVAALRLFGLPRDVASLIARFVFRSRDKDPAAWFSRSYE